jgi:hypothetical protein
MCAKKKKAEEKTEDLELEIEEDELADVSGGAGIRVGLRAKGARRKGARLKKLGLRDNPISSLRDGGRRLKKP